MSFIGDMFSGPKGSGWQAQSGAVIQQDGIEHQSADSAAALGNTNAALQDRATHGSDLARQQLQQATNQNIANATGVIASSKGINPAMAAREAGQQAANAGQNAAGQSAVTQSQIQQGALNSLGQNQLAQQQIYQGAISSANTANISNVAQQNQANSQIAVENQKNQGGFFRGLLGAAAGGASALAEGGEVGVDDAPMIEPKGVIADSSNIAVSGIPAPAIPGSNIQSSIGKILSGAVSGFASDISDSPKHVGSTSVTQAAKAARRQHPMAHGGKVKALLSPGEVYLTPKEAKASAKGEADPIKSGRVVPGKAKVKGDSYTNDTFPTTLEKGGIVIPRSVLDSKNPHLAAKKFVEAHLGMPKKKSK